MKMQKDTIEQQIDELFKLKEHLHRLLDKELYQTFQEQQELLAEQVKALIENNSPKNLNEVIDQLHQFEDELALLKNKADISFNQLKDKSLLHRRNKNRLKAYK